MTKLQPILALVFGGVVNLCLMWHFAQAAFIADAFGVTAAQNYLESLTSLYIALPLPGIAFWLARPDLFLDKE